MPMKSKNQNQTNPNKPPTSPRPWPDFPKQLLHIIGKQSTLMKSISFGGVTKTWRVPRKHHNPTGKATSVQLYENHDGNRYQNNPKRPEIFNISFYYGHFWWSHRGLTPRQDPFLHFVGHIVGQSHGLTIVKSTDEPCEYYLRDPVRWSTHHLPDWDSNIPFKNVAISSDPNNHTYDVVLVVTGIHHPALLFCGNYGGKYGWSKKDSDIMDPYSSAGKQLMQFTSVIGYKGKFYALSLQGALAAIEIQDSKLGIIGLSSSRAVPSLPSVHFREYLIESEEQILLIFLVLRKSIHVVDDVEIYQLEFEKLSWVKMTSLGTRTLFVGKNCSISVNASKVGCRANCVYFTHQSSDDDNDWWVYDMERNSILPGWEPSDSSKKSPVWDEPIAEE